jgi:hypothetical protein
MFGNYNGITVGACCFAPFSLDHYRLTVRTLGPWYQTTITLMVRGTVLHILRLLIGGHISSADRHYWLTSPVILCLEDFEADQKELVHHHTSIFRYSFGLWRLPGIGKHLVEKAIHARTDR